MPWQAQKNTADRSPSAPACQGEARAGFSFVTRSISAVRVQTKTGLYKTRRAGSQTRHRVRQKRPPEQAGKIHEAKRAERAAKEAAGDFAMTVEESLAYEDIDRRAEEYGDFDDDDADRF